MVVEDAQGIEIINSIEFIDVLEWDKRKEIDCNDRRMIGCKANLISDIEDRRQELYNWT